MDLRIKKICKEKGVTVTSLAKSVGMTQQNMSNIANGKVSPSLEKLEKIASILGVEMWELFAERKAPDLNAVIDYKGKSFVASSIDELEAVVNDLRALASAPESQS
jgi:transcriptional regulator with XRE-family HTH domain